MRVYRVHPWVEGADSRAPYGALFVPPGQGSGRWDNPDLYTLRYFSTTSVGAVAETYGSLARWSEGMLRVPHNAEAVAALSTYEIPDSSRLADLADPNVLLRLGVHRVTHIVERNKRRTQRLAANIHDSGEWDGITWWSYYHPSVTLVATWLDDEVTHVDTSALSIGGDTVQQAAQLIVREIRRGRMRREPH
ncbi:hypothetical protein BSP109_02904 [Brevibacterium sp. Mu109]|uniref:RES domain-containing protein n=1 Tax=Brevibacterium sp. Mu109 TaxID=1255669 RepID=UPI000C5A1453|nr:RES domain-containing protein [Brevibacterium sp. Mu109]SMX95808.1 hypothetical protein BSP109_02904 [Brevibacterium sp. Mu109]